LNHVHKSERTHSLNNFCKRANKIGLGLDQSSPANNHPELKISSIFILT
jgi:hypothetical protein